MYFIGFRGVYLYNSLPEELNHFSRISQIIYQGCLYIDEVPNSIPTSLKHYDFRDTISNLSVKIEDEIFNSEIEVFRTSSSYNLSDNILSNFFKINQLKNTLRVLEFAYCNNYILPIELKECLLLRDLRMTGNKYDHIPDIISYLPNLRLCYLGSTETLVNNSIPIMNGEKLESLILWFTDDIDFSDIPTSFAGLLSLNLLPIFHNQMNSSNSRFNEFINHFYTLITNEANITQDPNAFGGEYPYRFRNISWGHGSLSFTGTKQAPTGYVQGVSNGTPANEGEKVYVLQNQYGHVIDHA